jgi:guanylate kinase
MAPELELPEGPALLTVLSGFSGSGKDAVRDLLMAWKLPVHFVVTATNRPMRPGEVEGIDYLFVSDAEFDRMEREGELIEHAIVYGQKKGVPKKQVLEPLAAGCDVLARVDVQGAATLKELIPDAFLIFIAPPSMEEAAKRLTDRDTDSEEQRRIREQTAKDELAASEAFDHIVINETGKLEDTAKRVAELIAEEKRRRAAASA